MEPVSKKDGSNMRSSVNRKPRSAKRKVTDVQRDPMSEEPTDEMKIMSI